VTREFRGLEPLHDYVILKKNALDSRLPSGLYVPDTANRSSVLATVLAAGPGKLSPTGRLIPNRVESGDTVLVDSICGVSMTIGGEDIVVCREAEIIAKYTVPDAEL
jgi:chaperonin GroES